MGFDLWEASIICEKVADGVSLTNLSLLNGNKPFEQIYIPSIFSLNQKIKKYLNLYHLDSR